MLLAGNKIQIEYDEEIQSYYIAWNPLITIGMGKTEEEALDELRQAAHFGIDTVVDLELVEIGNKKGVRHGKQGFTKRRRNLGNRTGA